MLDLKESQGLTQSAHHDTSQMIISKNLKDVKVTTSQIPCFLSVVKTTPQSSWINWTSSQVTDVFSVSNCLGSTLAMISSILHGKQAMTAFLSKTKHQMRSFWWSPPPKKKICHFFLLAGHFKRRRPVFPLKEESVVETEPSYMEFMECSPQSMMPWDPGCRGHPNGSRCRGRGCLPPMSKLLSEPCWVFFSNDRHAQKNSKTAIQKKGMQTWCLNLGILLHFCNPANVKTTEPPWFRAQRPWPTLRPLPLHDVAQPEAHTGVKGGERNLSPLVHQEFTQV